MWRSLNISRKLTVVLWSASLGMMVVGGSVWWWHQRTCDERLAVALKPYAELLSVGLATPASLGQEQRAQEALAALRAAPLVAEACVVNVEGRVLARYQQNPHATLWEARPKPDGCYPTGAWVELVHSLHIEGTPVGRLHLVAAAKPILAQTRHFSYALLACGGLLLGLTAWQTWLARRLIARPVEALTQAMDEARARAGGELPHVPVDQQDELGGLAAHFNEMMAAIANQEKALHASNEFLQAILDNAGHAIICGREDGTVTVFNPAAEQLLGYAAAEVVGRHSALLFHDPAEVAARRQKLAEELGGAVPSDIELFIRRPRQGQVEEGEWTYLRKDGQRVPVWLTITALRGVGGRIQGYLGIAEDLTVRKQQEQELRLKNEELERFTYTVSHDLKSPLVTIKGFVGEMAQALREGDYTRMQDDFARVAAAANKMSELLNDLLELSRIGRVIYPPTAVPLEALAREVVMVLEGAMRERRAEVIIQPDLPVVRADRRRLFEVYLNLVENALKFMGPQPHPRVEIGWDGAGEQPVFYVQDNGLGVPPRYQETIFGLFNKLEAETPGTGIGLAIVRRIIEVHGGRIWVKSAGRGQGSCFCFTLGPDCRAPAAAPESAILEVV